MSNNYLEMFLNEAYSYIESINNALLELEKKENEQENIEVIFRNMHTLKGMAAAMSFNKLAELSHSLEDVFSKVKSGNLHLTAGNFDSLYNWVDKINEILDHIAQNGVEPTNEVEAINEIRKFLNSKNTGDLDLEPVEKVEDKTHDKPVFIFDEFEKNGFKALFDAGQKVYEFFIKIDKNAPMPSVRIYQIIQKLNEFGEILKTAPETKVLEESEDLFSFLILYTTDKEINNIFEIINAIREIDKVNVRPFVLKDMTENNKKNIDIKESSPKLSQNVKKKSILEPTIKVKIKHLDNLVNSIGELIISTIRLGEISKEYNIKPLKDEISNFQRITAELQDKILLARMVPVGQIFNKYPRIIRDLAKKVGKKVNFTITGSDIELDRIILDEIDEPLIHLLRNAVDHGIEASKERKRIGKPEIAQIDLIARREKNRVVIEVKDDGHGLDIEKIKNKALKMNIVNKEKLSIMSKSDIYMLICKPGFSTSEIITDVSGRGVGMDVVKNKIESLNGILNIHSTYGKGTTFSMILPSTLAIIQTLIVEVRGTKFLIPIANIQETMEIQKEDIKIIKNKEVVFLRDEVIVPLIRVEEYFGYEKKEKDTYHVVLVEFGEKRAGLIFDDFYSRQQTVVKNLDAILKKVKIYSGKGLLANGEPTLIIDLATLLE